MASTVTRFQSDRAPSGFGGTGESYHGGAADKLTTDNGVMLSCQDGANSLEMFPATCSIVELRKRLVQPCTIELYLIKGC